MPAIRPQDSVFSKPDHVAIHKQATLDDNWSSHVMDKVTSLSKRSVVAVGMVLATTSAMGQTPGTEPNPANAVQQMYEAGMRDKGQLKAWQDARPGLMIDNRVNGQSLSGAKSIAELMGVNPQTVSSDKTMPLFQQLEEALRDSGEYRGMASASTLEAEVRKELGDKEGKGGNAAAAALIGRRIAEKAKAAGIESVAFDRSGFRYHGRVKALADAAREAGLKF